MSLETRAPEFVLDRYAECSAPADARAEVDELLSSVRGGTSRALTLHRGFESGLSAVLTHAADNAHGFQVLRTRSQPAEQDLLYSGLLDLCEPLLDLVDELPDPQGPALRRALAGDGAASGDGLAVAVAARRLLVRAAARGPVLVLCDDAQWLDPATAAVLSFVAHRLPSAGIGVVIAVHDAPGSVFVERYRDLAVVRQAPQVTIRLLGDFEVTIDGRERTPEFGVPAQAVKLVATFGGRLSVDRMVEYLWPDAPLETGRARIRNVLCRARSQLGPVLLRDRHDIALAPHVEVDCVRFEEEATFALRSTVGEEASAAARQAVERYGELLPADRYADWTAVPRERMRRKYVALLDMLAAQAEANEDLIECLDWLDRAIEVERYDDSRYLGAARVLVRLGRVGRAGEYLRRAGAITADLGLTPRADVLALQQALLADAGVRPH
jgi:DNA-binding SARP family transcriptional activator